MTTLAKGSVEDYHRMIAAGIWRDLGDCFDFLHYAISCTSSKAIPSSVPSC